MINRLRVGIPIIGGKGWLGGIAYIEVLIKALHMLPEEERPYIYFVVTDETIRELTLHRHILPLIDSLCYVGTDPDVIRGLGQNLRHFSNFSELAEAVDFYFPVKAGVISELCSGSWIADFQHIHLPQFFSAEELATRDSRFGAIAAQAFLAVFSSKDAEKDFHRLFPTSSVQTRVLSFHALAEDEWYESDPEAVQHTYNLPNRFLICCNQFWAHKNHELMFNAFSRVVDSGNDIHLVCTGATTDYRNEAFFSNLQQQIHMMGISSCVHILGTIPRRDQIQLMRRALAVIQPSLFEGWSTVVEDARVLGKTIILSDLPVNYEQSPDYSHYFERNNVISLQRTIETILPILKVGPDSEREQQARKLSSELVLSFARKFCAISREAHENYYSRKKTVWEKQGTLVRNNVDITTDRILPPAVSSAYVEKQKEFWNASSLYEAMFERVYVDEAVRHLPFESKIASWNKSAKESMTAVLRGVPWENNWKVLEIGCGVGRIIKPMRDIFLQVDGIDIAEAMVAFAHQYLKEGKQNGTVVVNNGSDLHPLPDENYDLVFSMIVFQHIRAASVIASYLRETFRVLKPGGYFRLQVFDTSNPQRGKYNEEASGDVQYGLMGNGYTPEQLRGLLKENGFDVVDIQWTTPWIWATARRPLLKYSISEDPAILVAGGSAMGMGIEFTPRYKVSALVSTYNSEFFLQGCLEDLTCQSLFKKGELEIIIIDSGSVQGEKHIVEDFQRIFPNIVYLRTERETLYAAWNSGIAVARGMYLTNANTDDRHYPEALDILAQELDCNPAIDLVYANCKESTIANQTFCDCPENAVYSYPEFFPPRALLHYQFGPQPMWRKSLHDKIGMFDPALRCVGDYDFNIRFALKNLKAKLVPRVLGLFYLNPRSITNSDPGQQNEKRGLLQHYRTEENILSLFQNAGWGIESLQEKAIALTYLGSKAADFQLPWSSRKDSAPDLANFCHERALSYLRLEETGPSVEAGTFTERKSSPAGEGKRIAFFSGDCDNFHFAQPVMDFLSGLGYEIAAYRSNDLTTEKLASILRESALAWFEWGNGPIVAASHLPKSCPIVCRVHRYEVYGQDMKNINWLNVDALVFVNRVFVDVYKELADKDIEQKTNIKVIPNPVREDLPFKNRENNYRIAYISRFQSDKNPALMIQILAKLVSVDQRYSVHMIGRIQDVQLYQYCQHLVETLDLQNNFFYEGTTDDVPTWLDDKSFLLSTSIVESQGLAIMEAMMMGIKPVIHAGFGELDKIYSPHLLFRTVDEAVTILTSPNYNSEDYRIHVAERYGSPIVFKAIKKMFDSLIWNSGGSSSK